MSDGPNRNVRYLDVLGSYHRALWGLNALVDVVPVTADLAAYDVVVAPLLHMVKGDLAARLRVLVERGGSVLTTVLSGRVDEDDNAFLADAPGPLRDLLGLRVEETDAQQPSVVNPVTIDGVAYEARHVFEVVVPDDDTAVVGTYGADFYAGSPAVTRATRGRRRGLVRRDGCSTTRAWRPSCGASWTGTGSSGRSRTSTASRWSTASTPTASATGSSCTTGPRR